jgi:hypothetical protein
LVKSLQDKGYTFVSGRYIIKNGEIRFWVVGF